jgi:hypothetical protein
MVWPVMYAAAGEARNAITSPTSSAEPSRRIGIAAATSSRSSS